MILVQDLKKIVKNWKITNLRIMNEINALEKDTGEESTFSSTHLPPSVKQN